MEALHTAAVMLDQHPTNDIVHTESNSGQNNRSWIPNYHPISNLVVHTTISLDGVVNATYEAGFLPEDNDDRLRRNAIALPPNKREWHLLSVADRELWFHTEISNIVLAAWSQYPTVLQTSHARPHEGSTPADEVATAYSMQRGGSRAFLAVGEIRKNGINRDVWQSGNLTTKPPQNRLSQELRGHACKFQCPQVFYFDGSSLLLLQFRAENARDMLAIDCPVDCWVLPMKDGDARWRDGLYRLLAQGFRRIQGACAIPISIGGLRPLRRRFFNGQPVWGAPGGPWGLLEHPGGYTSFVGAGGIVTWCHGGDQGLDFETDRPFWTQGDNGPD